ncbi:SgcJ/EcaC family oxidoreductase [Catellatospora sp. TT07R-123]|uniref:SgcJ/EcaC family oxidoreductase n=1 Tax=Catellatospora sp. TT07R-123 TaxID=2733863 RepID=UPI001BB45B96|nr:SgcJ/EcaC family oxidoreductase [Catellatospora sp. TT07R-123]
MTISAASRPVSADDQASVLRFIQKITDSWNANEAEPLCEVYADDASILLPGAILKGRPTITEWMAAAFAGKWKGTHVLGHPLEYRYITDDVLLVVTHGGAYRPGATEVPVEHAIRGMWLFIRDDSEVGWTITAYANTPVFGTIELPETHLQ